MGKMMEQGPVLIITFQAQLVLVIRNTKGEVVEGDPVSTHTHTLSPDQGGGLHTQFVKRSVSLNNIILLLYQPTALVISGHVMCVCVAGEGAEDDVRVGSVSGSGRAEPKRCLETAGHLCL